MLVGEVVVFERSPSGDEIGLRSDDVDKVGEAHVDSAHGVRQHQEILTDRGDSAGFLKSPNRVFAARATSGVLVRDVQIFGRHRYTRPSGQSGSPVQFDEHPVLNRRHVRIIAR
jgi:hypothetical protein